MGVDRISLTGANLMLSFFRILICLVAFLPVLQAKRILFVTHTAGFRHDSIAAATQSMQDMAIRSEKFEVVPTEDLSLINAETLRDFDAVFFFTSGELALSDQQKADLLDFVQSGKGFGGAHCATDTLYTWPEYGEMIGAYFDGHPWAQEVNIKVEESAFPGLEDIEGNAFRFTDEIYQFRQFSRDRVRVLLSLDTSSVDLTAPGVNRTDGDFALAWIKPFGAGRVFYSALGHFDWSWTDERMQKILTGALLWLVGEAETDRSPKL